MRLQLQLHPPHWRRILARGCRFTIAAYCNICLWCATYRCVTAQRLHRDSLRLARRYARAQVPDGQILGALRAHARQGIDDPEALTAVLASLQAMHEADVSDLDDHRDLGIATVKLLVAAAAFGERLKPNMEPAQEGEEGEEVSGKACSMLQFMGRVFCAIDPAELREEAAREASRMADMSASDIRETIRAMAREVGLRVVEMEGAA
jgi:hypothetical protein